jgi:hypothetical protein
MFMQKKRRNDAFSDLRTRLEEYADMKDSEDGWYTSGDAEQKRNFLSYYPFSALRRMHSFIFVKTAIILLVILLVFSLSLVKRPFSAAIMQNINYLATSDTDFLGLGREAMPVLQRLWAGTLEEGWTRAVTAPAAVEQPQAKIDGHPHFKMPIEGETVRGFGLFEDAAGNTLISYGLLLSAPGEVYVYASAGGVVREIGGDQQSGYTLILEHQGGMETCYAYLLEVLVEEQETVEQGQAVARTGGLKTAEGAVVLYFEIREHGRPLNPLPLLTTF